MTEPSTIELASYVDRVWDEDIVPTLKDYIAIPCVSEAYDAQWREHGHMQRAVDLIVDWSKARSIAGLTVEVVELDGRSPLVFMEVPAFGEPQVGADDTVLLYGHLDKQPEMVGWREDLGPWKPVVEDGRLYGRGGADDGYSVFASLLAIEAAQRAGLSHARCVVLIEASEESGSPDLPPYLEALADRIGSPSLVLCLDSGCLDYERMWATTSLRGLADGVLRVEVLTEGVHSGEASGVVPSSFRIVRQLLDRIEDPATGDTRLRELRVEIPRDRLEQAHATAEDFTIAEHFPFAEGVRPTTDDPAEQLLRRTWHPTLSVTGVDGIPDLPHAGNVLRPHTTLRLSVRLPPTCDSHAALRALERALTHDAPNGARVTFTDTHAADGWNAPEFEPWLEAALDEASLATWGQPARTFGEGGSIPFMGMLASMFPQAQFVITGVLGPGSNAHGPNEYLHLPSAQKITTCLAMILAAHAAR